VVPACFTNPQARRRLARQFRRHKLEPQTAGSFATRLANSHYDSQLVRPRNRYQQQSLLNGSDQEQQWEQLERQGPDAAIYRQLHPADVAAAAAARKLLEWQFQLEPEDGFESSRAKAATGAGSAAAEADGLQLPSSLLQGLSTSPDVDAGKELTKAIMRAGLWRQVQALIQEHAPEMVNVQHLCAALTRMVDLQPTFSSMSGTNSMPAQQQQQQQHEEMQEALPGTAQASRFLQQLYSSLGEKAGDLSYRQSCNVLWAAGKLKHTALPNMDWLAALYAHTQQSCVTEQRQLQQQQQAEDASPQDRELQLQWQANALSHAGQVASSLVALQEVLPAQQLQDTLAWIMSNTRDVLQEHIQQHQPVPEQRSSSKQPPQQQRPWVQRCCQRPLPARDVANLAASLATLGAQPSPAWLSAFAAALGCKGLVYIRSYRDLSQLLWATAMFSRTAAEGSAAANSIQAAAAALLCTAQTLPLSSCDGQALANTLWALATLGQRPPLPWLNRVLQHAEAAAVRGFLSAQGVAMTLWALAALAVVPQASCLTALLTAAQQHLRHFTTQGCSNVLWALAVLERPPSKEWLAGFWPQCRTLLPQMTSQGLVNCLWSAARLGLQPPQEWVGDVAGLLLERGVGSLTSQGISNMVWSLSKVSITCKQAQELLQACQQHAVLMLQQQWQAQQEQQQAEQQLGESSSSSSSSGVDASSSWSGVGFNIHELSGLLNAVCQLKVREAAQQQQQQQQQQQLDPSSSSSSSSIATAADGDLLGQLTLLLQEVSVPLLPTAGPTELSIMLWSQVAMATSSTATNLTPSSSSSSSSSKPSGLVIPRKWMAAWFAATRSSFSAASSRDLAMWMWCLAKKGAAFKPNPQWLASWQVASYRQLGRASSQVG